MRGALFKLVTLLVLAAGPDRATADDILIRVDGRPPHGIVASRVDLTAVAKWCRVGPIRPENLRAVRTRDGRPVPFQFVPDADFGARERATGTVFLRLAEDGPTEVRLIDRPSAGSEAADSEHKGVLPHVGRVSGAGRRARCGFGRGNSGVLVSARSGYGGGFHGGGGPGAWGVDESAWYGLAALGVRAGRAPGP